VRIRTKFIKHLSAVVLSLFFAQLSISPSAHADPIIFESLSPVFSTNPEGLRNDHYLRSLAVYVNASNPDLITIKLAFAGTVGPTTFTSNSFQLRLKILPFLTDYAGNAGHLWLDAPKIPYEGTKKLPVAASAYSLPTGVAGSPRKDMSTCGATTWMDDVSNQNLVSFQLSRNCFDLTNTLYVIAYIEEDIYNSTQTRDSKYVPTSPMYLDMRNIPRPPKVVPKKDQTITASTALKDYFVDNSSIQVVASSSAGGALSYSSRTPEICAVTPTGVIQPKTAGSCQVAVSAPGSDTLNPAGPVVVTVNLTRKTQNLYFNPPGTVYLSERSINLAISSEFNLPVQVVSTTPTVCSFPYPSDPTRVEFLRVGTCGFIVSQAGNFIYNPREGSASFFINADPKSEPTPKPGTTSKPTPKPATKPTPKPKPSIIISGSATAGPSGTGGSEIAPKGAGGGNRITITCVKRGAKDIKVTNTKPKCPAGYTKK
jgi:hypothetical protein